MAVWIEAAIKAATLQAPHHLSHRHDFMFLGLTRERHMCHIGFYALRFLPRGRNVTWIFTDNFSRILLSMFTFVDQQRDALQSIAISADKDDHLEACTNDR